MLSVATDFPGLNAFGGISRCVNYLPLIGITFPGKIMAEYRFKIDGMTCGACAARIQDGLEKAAGVEKGSKIPHMEKVGKLTRAQAEDIAKAKMPDLTAADLDAAVRTIAGSARSMGITVEGVK